VFERLALEPLAPLGARLEERAARRFAPRELLARADVLEAGAGGEGGEDRGGENDRAFHSGRSGERPNITRHARSNER